MITVSEGLGGSFGEYFRWRTYEEGMKEIKEKKRPGLLLIHRDWCQTCQNLGRYCRKNIPLIKMSKKFVMISAPNGEEPQDDTYKIGSILESACNLLDGSYFPRIYFINPDGSVNYDIISDPNAEKYQFFYPDAERILDSMKQMIKELKAKRQRKRQQKQRVEVMPDATDSEYLPEDL